MPKKTAKSPTPYKVLEDDHHDQASVHVFRDRAQFENWAIGQFDEDFDVETWREDRTFVDGNGDTWSEYTGFYEHDHTKEDL